jgi:hypothetical protein
MSEATLKRKTQTKYNNMSVGSKNGGFSINGTRRSQGYVGQTMLGRHFPTTPMRGNVARGSGGCCGTYYRGTIVQSGVCFPSNPINGSTANNNPSVVKPSVLNNSGMIRTHYKWIWRPQPYTSVKVDSNLIQGSQQQYISNISSKTIKDVNACTVGTKTYTANNICGRLLPQQRPRPFGTVINIPRKWCNITKTDVQISPISQGAFIAALNGSCANNFTKAFTNGLRAPLPGPAASY